MGINIKNPAVESQIRELARLTGKGQTEVVGEAVELMLAREKRRGLAAYRTAVRLESVWLAFDGELRANLRATFGDREHGEAAFALAEQLGAPMAEVLAELAQSPRDGKLARRAQQALERMRAR